MCAVPGCPGAVVLELLGQSLRGLSCAEPPEQHMVRCCSVAVLGQGGGGVQDSRHGPST